MGSTDGTERAIPEGLLVDDAVAPADEHHRSRQFLVLNRLAHEGLDEFEATRFDRRLFGGRGASRGHWRARRAQPGGRLSGQANQQDQRQQLVHGPGLYLCVSRRFRPESSDSTAVARRPSHGASSLPERRLHLHPSAGGVPEEGLPLAADAIDFFARAHCWRVSARSRQRNRKACR